MSIALEIRLFIGRQNPGFMFAPLELMHFGSRDAVYQTLVRMKQKKQLQRLSSGFYMVPGVPLPEDDVIVEAKAKVFGKKVYKDASKCAEECGFENTREGPVYSVVGSSSKFWYRGRYIYMRSVAPRKIEIADTKPGDIIRGIWEAGQEKLTPSSLQRALRTAGRKEMEILRTNARRMPLWLWDFLRRDGMYSSTVLNWQLKHTQTGSKKSAQS